MSGVTLHKTHFLLKRWAVPEVFGKGPLANAVREQSKFAQKLIKTPLPALNPVFAFAFRTKYEKQIYLRSTRTVLDLHDGGAVGIDKMELEVESSNESDPSQPTILIFPGGNENKFNTKVQTLCSAYLNAGFSDVFVCNYRGRCHTPFRNPRLSFPLGEYNDVGAIVSYFSDRFKDRPILLVGNCYGSHFIMDYLTRGAEIHSNVIGGVVHSMVWDVMSSNETLLVEPNYSLYVKPFVKFNKNLLVDGQKGNEKFAVQIYEKLGKEKMEILSSLSMEQPGDVYPLYDIGLSSLVDGAFKGYKDYCAQICPNAKIKNSSLSRSLVVVNAADDPMNLLSLTDLEQIELDPNICFWLFAAGGHCSYVKNLFPVRNFIDEVMVECSDILAKNFGGVK